MQKLNKKEIQDIILNLIVEFDKICRENNFNYALGGGSCLGAIRHKGFIPWDDDADIAMPRPDYNKFLKYCKENDTSFEIYNYDENKDCYIIWTRVCDKNTIFVKNNKNLGFGCYIDIFPVDGIGNDIKLFKEKVKENKIVYYSNLLMLSPFKFPPLKNKKSFKAKRNCLLEFLSCKFIGKNKMLNHIYDFMNQYDYDNSEYFACFGSPYLLKTLFKNNIYADTIDVEFEGYIFKTFKNYDTYLKAQYNDYMTLPPIEKREDNHSFDIYLKNKE